MDKAFYQFKEQLEKLLEESIENYKTAKFAKRGRCKEDEMNILRLLNNFEFFENGFDQTYNNLVYNDFSILTRYLELTTLSTKDILTIFNYVIRLNLRPLAKDLLLYESAYKIDEQNLTKEERREREKNAIKKFKKQRRFLTSEEKMRISEEQSERLTNYIIHLYFFKVKRLESLEEVIKQCKIYNDLILANPYYTDEDIEKSADALRTLLVNHNFIDEIVDYLKENKLEKPAVVETKEKVVVEVKVEEPTKENRDSEKNKKKEYRESLILVREYYDPETKEFVKPIPYEQIINMVALLYELGYKDEDICSFLKKSKGTIDGETPARDYSNLTLDYVYMSLSAKFKYYAENVDSIKPHIHNFNIYFDELKKCTNKNDYDSWRDIWVEEINTINSIIGSRYDYEMTTAKTLLKVMENEY